MTVFHVLHGAVVLYWYPGTSVISENRRFGCAAADTVADTAKLMKIRVTTIFKNGMLHFAGAGPFFYRHFGVLIGHIPPLILV